MRNLALVFCCLLFSFSRSQTLTLNSLSPDVFCSKGNDTMKFSVTYSGVPANSNIVFYQSTNPAFDPYAGQGDSIGFIHIDGSSTSGNPITTTCPKILGIFIDACNDNGRSEPANEYMVITSGATGFLASTLAVNVPNNVAPPGGSGLPPNSHNDINTGASPCSFGTPSAALMTSLRQGSCNATNLLPANQSTFIPANALVIIFTGNGTDYPYNFSSFCDLGQPIYILQNSCTRDTSSGAFVNNEPNSCTTASNSVRYRNTSITTASCFDELTYDRCGLGVFNAADPNANDGNYVIQLDETDTSSVSNGGILNNSVNKCNGVVLDSLSVTKIITYKIPNDGSSNPVTNFCNTGYHYIKAITNPGGTQPISNTVQFKLICLNLSVFVPDNPICTGENAVINNNSNDPNATFSWVVFPGTNISGASPGSGPQVNQVLNNSGSTRDSVTYRITAQDNSCNIIQDVKIYVDPTPPGFSLGPDTSVCGPFSKTLSTGNAATIWSTGATAASITVNNPGTYWAKVPTTCGETSDTINILLNGTANPVNLGADTTVCGPFSKTLSTGDPSTVWSTGATASSITVSTPGTYWARITTVCGSISDTMTILSNSLPAVNLGPDTTVCGSFSKTLSTGDASTVWSTGATASSITVNSPGTYWARITNSCGTVSDTINILTGAAPTINLGPDTSVCGAFSKTLSTGDPSTVWSTGNTGAFITVSSAGTYWATISNGCGTASDTIVITQNSIAVSIAGITTLCIGQTTTLDAGAGFATYSWSTGATSQTITVSTAGQYIVNVTQNGCSAADTADVTVAASGPPVVNITGDSLICFGEPTTLDAGTGFTSYSWSTGAAGQTVMVNQPGQYKVTVFDGTCFGFDSIVITQLPQLSLSLDVDSVTCLTLGAITVANVQNGTAPFAYQLNNGSPQAANAFDSLSAGNYTVFVTDTNGCAASADVFLDSPPQILLDLGNDVSLPLGEYYQIPGTIAGAQAPVSFNWTPQDSLSCLNCVDPLAGPDSTTKYVLLVTDSRGCTATDSVVITVYEIFKLFVPNGFTPNMDGVNDLFGVLYASEMASFKMMIFNRWGEKIFETANVGDAWDGTYKGAFALTDAYVYYIDVITADGEHKEYKGTVTLVR